MSSVQDEVHCHGLRQWATCDIIYTLKAVIRFSTLGVSMGNDLKPSMIDPRPMMESELRARAAQLASILDIPFHVYGENISEANQIMGRLAAMPYVRDSGRRRDYGIEILANTNLVFNAFDPRGGQFFHCVQMRVVDIQISPDWFHSLTDSNDKLVNDYRLMKLVVDAMRLAGFTGPGAVGAKTFAGGITGFAKAAETRAGVRAVAIGTMRGAGEAGAKVFTGGLATRASIFAWIIGQAVFVGLQQDNIDRQKEIARRYQEHRMSSEIYQKAFGTSTSLPPQYFFKF